MNLNFTLFIELVMKKIILILFLVYKTKFLLYKNTKMLY